MPFLTWLRQRLEPGLQYDFTRLLKIFIFILKKHFPRFYHQTQHETLESRTQISQIPRRWVENNFGLHCKRYLSSGVSTTEKKVQCSTRPPVCFYALTGYLHYYKTLLSNSVYFIGFQKMKSTSCSKLYSGYCRLSSFTNFDDEYNVAGCLFVCLEKLF